MRDQVCIIIPTRDPERVRALIQQCFAQGWEECVVVHPGNSVPLEGAVSIGTGALLSPAAARNCGARATEKPLLCFLDDDVIIHDDTIERLVTFCTDNQHVAVGPRLTDHQNDGYWRRCMHRVMAGQQGGTGSLSAPDALMSMMLVVNRMPFWQVGGFDESYQTPAGEDTALTMRLGRQGTLGIDWSVHVHHHPHPDGWLPATRRLWHYGRAWAHLCTTEQRLTTWILGFPPPIRLVCIAGVPLLAGYDALLHTTPRYVVGYAWLRMCWYVAVLTAPRDRDTA